MGEQKRAEEGKNRPSLRTKEWTGREPKEVSPGDKEGKRLT